MSSHKIDGSLSFRYYYDLARAEDFYGRVLGLTKVVDQGYAKIFQIRPHAFLGIVDSEKGTLKPSADKPIITAFVMAEASEVDKWYTHLQAQGVTIFKPLKQSDAIGVYGFMALDPEGYVLEFEHFMQTERNEAIRSALR